MRCVLGVGLMGVYRLVPKRTSKRLSDINCRGLEASYFMEEFQPEVRTTDFFSQRSFCWTDAL